MTEQSVTSWRSAARGRRSRRRASTPHVRATSFAVTLPAAGFSVVMGPTSLRHGAPTLVRRGFCGCAHMVATPATRGVVAGLSSRGWSTRVSGPPRAGWLGDPWGNHGVTSLPSAMHAEPTSLPHRSVLRQADPTISLAALRVRGVRDRGGRVRVARRRGPSGGGASEEDANGIAERVRKSGASEHEARILRHLDEAGRLFYELPGLTRTDRQTCAGHVSALVRVLASRVAEREHPEGWFFSEGHADR